MNGYTLPSKRSSQIRDRNKRNAKNIIFMVSDGMSMGTLHMADLLKSQKFGSHSNWIGIYNSDRSFQRRMMDMASLNSPVTDSAAASSSWGSGNRVNNGAINTGPEGQKYLPINQILKAAGKKVGLVTTARITHATPAGFSISIADRNNEDEIALKYLEQKYDLLMGGGKKHFSPDHRSDGKDLISTYNENGYNIAFNKQQMLDAPPGEALLGLFDDCHLPFALDQESERSCSKSVPSLAEMTQQALLNLESQEGFILQIESGRVDHGAHDKDAAAMLTEQLVFDETLGVVLDFVDSREDTLLIITTDHGNSNPSFVGQGEQYLESNNKFQNVHGFKHSYNWILSHLDAFHSVSQIRECVEYATGLSINAKEGQRLQQTLKRGPYPRIVTGESAKQALGNIISEYTGIEFTKGDHTGDYVELVVLGPGQQSMPHFVKNTDLFTLMTSAIDADLQAMTVQ